MRPLHLLVALTAAAITHSAVCQAATNETPSAWDKDIWLLETHSDMRNQDPCESTTMYLPLAYCAKYIRGPLQEHASKLTPDQGHVLVFIHVAYR